MTVDDVILLVLLSWLIPLLLHEFYSLSAPVEGTRWLRKPVKFSDLTPITRMLLLQKAGLILVVTFIGVVRLIGNFPGREWVALGLYTALVGVAWVIFTYMRRLQKPGEREIRSNPPFRAEMFDEDGNSLGFTDGRLPTSKE